VDCRRLPEGQVAPMTDRPLTTEERWRQITRELGVLGYSREMIDAIETEEEAWSLIEKLTPSRKANGANGPVAGAPSPSSPSQPNQEPPEPKQPQADDDRTSYEDELIELPDAIRSGIDMWHRAMLRRERPATDILELAAHDLFAVMKQSKVEFPRLQDASHQAVVDALQEMAQLGSILDDDATRIMGEGKRAADDPDRNTNARDSGGCDQTNHKGKQPRQGEHKAEPPSPEVPADAEPSKLTGAVLHDFWAYLPTHRYIFTPSGGMWPAVSVNSQILPVPLCDKRGLPLVDDKGLPKTIAASKWLDEYRHVEQITWAPGLPRIIQDRLVDAGGWVEHRGAACYNLYRPPTLTSGDATKAGPWIDHVCKIYGGDADHVIMWLAQRVQHPEIKINHALVLGGPQGIGKDTLLEPVKYAVGPWNFNEASPEQALGRFKGFLKSVILRLSEASDLGDFDRFKFYDAMKVCTAAPPDVLRIDEKFVQEYSIINVVGIIITSNHKTDGIYLPADDRRHFVAWSELTKDDFTPDYWNTLWRWYANGGINHVAAYLSTVDISAFDPKKPPRKTPAFWAIVDTNRAPEDAELADVLDMLGRPDAVTIARIISQAPSDFQPWLLERKNRRIIPHRMEQCGYVRIHNDSSADGMWVVGGKRQVVYVRDGLLVKDQFVAARRLAEDGR
jgi:hypothetical protein